MRTWTTPAKLWLQPWAADMGTMATDMTTRSALHSAMATATMATTFARSELQNLDNRPDLLSTSESENAKSAPVVATWVRAKGLGFVETGAAIRLTS